MDDMVFYAAMDKIIVALKEKGYEPYEQLYGYIKENQPAYITKHNGARELIVTLDNQQVKHYVEEMKKQIWDSKNYEPR